MPLGTVVVLSPRIILRGGAQVDPPAERRTTSLDAQRDFTLVGDVAMRQTGIAYLPEAKYRFGTTLVVSSSKSAALYNRKQRSKGSSNFIDESLHWKEAVIGCKHYGAPRSHEHVPGTKERANQSTFKTHCKAKFNVNYSVKDQCFEITKLEEQHSNHPINDKFTSLYPEFRKIPKEAVEAAEDLLENDVKAHHIRSKVCSYGVLATRQDIQNLRNRWKKKKMGGKTPEAAVFDQLEQMLEEDPGSVAVINHDADSGVINSIFFQTSSMKKAYSDYPEVLIMDTTYKLCDNDMPLIVFQTIDCYGSSRNAGYAIISSEKKEIVSHALSLICRSNNDAFQRLGIVVVDKDQSEIAAIKEIAPHAEIHLCDYHSKVSMEKGGKKHHGSNYMEDVHPIVLSLIHAHSKEEFDEAYGVLKTVANPAFMDYYHKYWHNSGLVWSDYQRNLSLNLKARTTGRVESQNAKIKILVSKAYPVAEVIFRLRMLNKFKDLDNDYKDFTNSVKVKYHKYSNDAILQQIIKLNTPFVAAELQRNYERSKHPPSSNLHTVSLSTCDCKYYSNTKLPCSHIFRQRKLEDVEVYDHDLIPPRWKANEDCFAPELEDEENDLRSSINFMATSSVKVPKRKKTLTSEQKYTECMKICTEICSKVANSGGQQYEYNLNALMCISKYFSEGKKVAVVTIDANNKSQGIVYPLEKKDTSEVPVINIVDSDTEDLQEFSSPVVKPEPPDVTPSNNDKGDVIPCHRRTTTEVFEKMVPGAKLSLKLPVKAPKRGRPRNNKRHPMFNPKSKRKQGQGSDAGEDDADEVGLSPKVCSSCQQVASIRTSFSKMNRGRKMYHCKNPKGYGCRKFFEWLPGTNTLDTILEDNEENNETGDDTVLVEEIADTLDASSEEVEKDQESGDDIVLVEETADTMDTISGVDKESKERGDHALLEETERDDNCDISLESNDTAGHTPTGGEITTSIMDLDRDNDIDTLLETDLLLDSSLNDSDCSINPSQGIGLTHMLLLWNLGCR
ncbi:uncharacterized protein LOC117644628 [Thrips palmi]|uniref:Uncharacterized protein LOC117644628 n=1 Tax=Thrips palmi TaxID=161013 RepID=A0A6P8YRY1_THRPL|nr:uncharacterized protein LOC117644628 [Thrips palmi]